MYASHCHSFRYLFALGWEHLNLTGGYVWRQSQKVENGQFRPLRILGKAQRTIFSLIVCLPLQEIDTQKPPHPHRGQGAEA